MAPGQHTAAAERGTSAFVDESGLSERPHRVRTWALQEQTPVLQLALTWTRVSGIAGGRVWTFAFRLSPGPIRSPQIVDFRCHLRRHLRRKRLLIRDGHRAHRSRLGRRDVEACQGAIRRAALPADAPELTPVEEVWGACNQHELATCCRQDLVDSVKSRAVDGPRYNGAGLPDGFGGTGPLAFLK